MNKVLLFGKLMREPESREAGETFICKLRVGTSELGKKDPETGKWKKYYSYHDVVVFGAKGKACDKNLVDGQSVAVEGKLKTSSWEKDGQKRYKTEVIADMVEFGDRTNVDSESAQARPIAPDGSDPWEKKSGASGPDEEMPF